VARTRYVGSDRAEEFGKRNAAHGERWLVGRAKPSEVINAQLGRCTATMPRGADLPILYP
jgi:hypothetical protein